MAPATLSTRHLGSGGRSLPSREMLNRPVPADTPPWLLAGHALGQQRLNAGRLVCPRVIRGGHQRLDLHMR